MKMYMLVETLQSLGESPLAWGVVGLLGAAAGISAWRYRSQQRCTDGTFGDRDAARAYLDSRIAAGPQYLVAMLAGIAAMIAGLAMIAGDMHAELGFFVLVAGICTVQLVPLRQRIRIADARVAAAASDDADQREVARENLRDAHRAMVAGNVLLALLVALGLMAF